MKQAREMQASLVRLEADNLAASAVAAPGPPVALAVANATVPSARGDQTPGGGCGLPASVVHRPSPVVGAFGAVNFSRAA